MILKRPREVDGGDQPSKTKQLANWIHRVRYKKLMYRKNGKNRNLRVEAVLTNTLHKAEYELRDKQLSRIKRWQQLRKEFKDAQHNNFSTCQDDLSNSKERKLWKGPLCSELSSLDDFMTKLSNIKSHRLRWEWNGWLKLLFTMILGILWDSRFFYVSLVLMPDISLVCKLYRNQNSLFWNFCTKLIITKSICNN